MSRGFFDAGNNAEIEKYWRDSAIEAVEKFVLNHSNDNFYYYVQNYL